MNKRQHQALVQSALQKIMLYQQKQFVEKQKRALEEANTNQSLMEFNRKSELRRREIMKKVIINEVTTNKTEESKEEDSEKEISEVKQDLIEAIQEQEEIESNLVTQTAELKQQFAAEFAELQEQCAEEISLQIVDEE